jgi:hypothetical protein
MTGTTPTSRFTVEDLGVLQAILKDYFNETENESVKLVDTALVVIIEKKALDHAKKYICMDDCAVYTGEGFNALIYEAPLRDLPKLRIDAGYLGKAIAEWRMKINK